MTKKNRFGDRFVKRARGRGTRLFLEALEERTLLSVTPAVGFDGLNSSQIVNANIRPPDSDGAVGPNSFINFVNVNIQIDNKSTGAPIAGGANTSAAGFFSSLGTSDPAEEFSDPVVVYNDVTGKFGVGILDFHVDGFGNPTDSRFDFAISKTNNPTLNASDWNFFRYNTDDGQGGSVDFSDFPKMGFNADGFVVSFNMFPSNANPLHVSTLSIANNGTANLNVVANSLITNPNGNFTLAPASEHGAAPGDPMWFVETGQSLGNGNEGGGSTVTVVKMTNVFSASPVFSATTLSVAAYNAAVTPSDPAGQFVGQADLGTRIDFSDLRTVAGVTHLVTADTVGNAAGTNDQVAWYDFNVTAAPTLIQTGRISGGAGVDDYLASAAIASDGSIGLTYDQSSASQFMSMYVTGRTATDTAGTLETSVLAQAGTGDLTFNDRIGDYSFTSVDPTDNKTFWSINEYAKQSLITGGNPQNWATWIQSYTVPTGAPPPPPTGTITGRVFNDVPHAGLELASDPGLANWTVYIDQTNVGHFVAGDPTALTAANGTYTFTNVAAGPVKVGEIVKPNFVESVPTSGGEQTVTVTAATTTPGVDFGDFQIVTPTVYDDSNLPANFQLFGSGWKFQNVGVNGESRYHAGTASPSTFAQWTTAPSQNGAGAYELYATWPAKPTDATNATYQIFDQHTGNFLGSVTMDQTKAPTQANVGGTFFQKLGTFSSSNGSFVIKLLTDGANGNVVADAVMEASPPLGHNQKVLFYAGDFDATNPNANALANERNTLVTQASTFQNFVVPVGQTWTITGLYSNDFLIPGTTITGADWSIHSGVSSGNGGFVIASASNATANLTATGRTDFGLTEDSVAVSGLHVVLGPGTYWMNVTPVGNGSGRSFNSNTFGQEQVGSDIANQQFWNSSFFAVNFANANGFGTYPNFSDGVIGSDPALSGSSLLAPAGAATAPAAVSSGTPSVSTGAAGSPAASLSTANLDSFFAQLGAAAGSGSSSGPVVLSGSSPASASGAFSTAVTHVSSANSTASVDDLFAALAQRKHGSGSSDLG